MSVNVKCVRKYPVKSTKNVLIKKKAIQMHPDGTEDMPIERTFQEKVSNTGHVIKKVCGPGKGSQTVVYLTLSDTFICLFCRCDVYCV